MGRVSLGVIAALFSLALSAAARAEATDPPAFAYLLHCSGCHLEDGSGDPKIVPDLRHDLGLLLDSPEGRSYMLRVPGVADTPIAAQEMTDLMNWLIGTLYPQRVDFVPFSIDEVRDARENRLSDPLKYRKQLFSKLLSSAEVLGK